LGEKKFKIALVEDDENHVFLIKTTLCEFKSVFEVDSFLTGADLFDDLDANNTRFDAIIVDYTLPKMSGLDILKKLNSQGYDIPIVFVTNREDEEIIHEALQYGAYDYVLKKDGFLTILPIILLKSIDKYHCQKHKAEFLQNLQNLKEYFENIINTLPYTVIGLNSDLEISYVSSECHKLFYMMPSDIIGSKIIDFFEPQFLQDTKLVSHIKQLMHKGDPVSLTRVKFIDSKRDKKVLNIQMFKISAENESNIILVINDVTCHVEMEQKLVQNEKLASFGKLLTGITHELNNRISPILAYAQLLIAREMNPKNLKWLKCIEESSQSVKSIVDSLLYFSSSSPQQNKEKVDINQTIEAAISLLKYKFQSKNIKIVKDFKTNVPEMNVDKKQISKVFLNLLTNSYEAMEHRGGEIYISTDFDDSVCRIVIKDTGVGIPEEILNDIFDPFFTTKSEKNNVGLGLSIVYNLLQNHKGTIQITSQEQKGTAITITLPVEKSENQSFIKNLGSSSKGSKILIIDDDEFLRDVMKDILEESYEVDIAESGDQAITKITSKNEYNLILTDIRMPGIDGPTLYNWVKNNYPGLEKRMVFTTGDTYDPETNKFLDSIGNIYISKPFFVDDLRKVVKKMLA